MFVYIHPYFDGNGRMGRFLMNVMMAAGGYPWTVVTVDTRDDYVVALEQASVRQNIGPFAEYLAALVGEVQACLCRPRSIFVTADRPTSLRRRTRLSGNGRAKVPHWWC